MPRLALVVSLLALAATVPARAPLAQGAGGAPAGQVRGVLVAREAGVPLAHGVVSIPALGLERFTDDAGRFVLAGVPAGRHQLLARHLGFSPVRLDVVVDPARGAEVRVELPRLAVRLATIRVRADPRCARPGPPSAAEDGAFAALFDQLQQNAERMRLLSDAHPLAYAVERTLAVRLRDGTRRVQAVDTLASRSDGRAQYRPGRVVRDELTRDGRVEWVVAIPTLLDFADSTFQHNHCFDYGGAVVVDGDSLLRIDFRAAARLATPDVDGAFFLDPSTYQVRRSELRLTRVPRQVRDVTGVAVTTWFHEIVSGVPVIGRVSGENAVRAGRGRRAVAATLEEQRLLRAHFLRGAPGEPPGGA